jgi:hypothetical protein
MRLLCILSSAMIAATLGGAAQIEVPRVLPHPQVEIEVPFTPDDAWTRLDDKPHITVAPVGTAFQRHRVPQIATESREWSGVAWRGERIHVQVVLWSKRGLMQLRAEPAPLADSAGRSIPSTAVRVRFVRYVVSELPAGARKTHCDPIDTKNSYLVPDLLDPEPRMDAPPGTARPVWVTVDVPRDAIPGSYSGTVRFRAEGGFDAAVSLKLEVQRGVVPPPAQWKFRVDFWQNPWAVAHQHRVLPWSDAHLAILRQHLTLLADMGQTYVSAYITHSPWKDDTYIADGTMVEWIREPDGRFTFDYSIFDKYVQLAISCGIDDAICCFTMIPWNSRVRYLDRKSGDYVWANWPLGSAEHTAFWKAALADLRAHLKRRGWFPRTYLEVNERSLEDTLRSVQLARSESPEWKFTFAGGYHRELVDQIDDLCTVVDNETPDREIATRRARGQTSTFYVACEPAFPNNFTFSPPAENVWMGWHAAARGMDGFLRWAWDTWPADPIRDSRHFRFPAGDTYIVYPGPLASIRMELLREGFVDNEKLRALRERIAGNSSGAAREAIARLDSALSKFAWERVKSTNGETIEGDVLEAREALAAATRVAFSDDTGAGRRN